MRELCFCGWSGDLEDKEPIYLGDGAWGLACPGCGRPDDLTWLPAAAAWSTFAEACGRHEARAAARAASPPPNATADAPRRAA